MNLIFTSVSKAASQFKRHMRSIVAVFALLALSQIARAQVPANDEICNAAVLTAGATCSFQSFTTVDATPSSIGPAPTCGNYTGDDVWFRVTIPTGATAVIIDSRGLTMGDGAMAAYSATGACPTTLALTQIACDDNSSTNASFPKITVPGAPGDVIYVRFWGWGGELGTFQICAFGFIPPPNDACANPTPLTVNPDYLCGTQTAGTTFNGTQSTQTPNPTCGNAAGFNDDVWYSFVATTAAHRIVLNNVSGGTAMTMQVYTGTCNTLATVAGGCIQGNTLNLTGLIPTTTYLVRVYTNVATPTVSATFNICVGTAPPPPANDNCIGAQNVPVNPTLTCTQTIAGNTESATPSTVVTSPATPSCGNAAGFNDDVWFSFVATNASHWVSLSNVSGGTAMTFTVFSGTCAGTLTEIGCSTTGIAAINGLTPTQTYYVRVYTNVATVGTVATFNICVATPPPPPGNDECAGATNVPVNPNYNCGTVVAGNTAGATPSTGAPAPTCGNVNGINDDVWYSFVATGTSHRVSILGVNPVANVITFQVFSGTCGSLTQIGCNTGGLLDLTGLTALQTYYVRVYTNVNVPTTTAAFNICVGTPPPPPTNDECAGAIALTVNSDANCGATTPGYTVGATLSTGMPIPNCGTANGWNDDVWFSFVATNVNQQVNLLNIAPAVQLNSAVYTGTSCGALTLVQCITGPINNLYGLTLNQTYYVRVYTDATATATAASFNICVGTIPPPAAGTICNASQPFCSTGQPSQASPTNQPTLGQFGCLFTTPNPTWYVLQVQNPGLLQITMNQQTPAGVGIDVDFAIWGPFTSVSQGCAAIVPGGNTTAPFTPPMIDCSYSTAATEVVDVPNAQTGQIYILLVTNFNGASGTITFTSTPGGATTNCGFVCNATASNNGPSCPNGTVQLTGNSTNAGATYSWSGPNGFTSAQQNPTVTIPAAPGAYVYTLTVTANGNTCVATTTVVVSATASITLTSAAGTANQTTCNNQAITPITYSIAGGNGATTTGLPAGITGTYAAGVYTISGAPTGAVAPGNYPFTITTTGNCAPQATISGSITVNQGVTINPPTPAGANTQTICLGSAITSIVYQTANGATGASATGLPAGVTGTYSGGVNGTYTISGTPTAVGISNYVVTTTGGCGTATANGTITVNQVSVTLTSAAGTAAQTVCINSPITTITYQTGNGATGASVSNLPAGVTGTYSGGTNGTVTISGSPTTTTGSPFTYTVTVTGCGTTTATGTITVNPNATITLSSAAGTNAQNICVNTALTPITYTVTGATGATISPALPAGLTGTFAGGVYTISGTPTTATATPYTYTVTTAGGCGSATATGTITVRPASTITLSSAPATTSQTVCINTAITAITYTTANGVTGATVAGLPAGVTGTYSGGTNGTVTISGSPTTTTGSPFTFTVTTSGGCGTATAVGSITVNPNVTITLSSAAGTTAQTPCVNSAITSITYTTANGVTGATVTGLPTGVTGTYSGGTNGTITISGSPTVTGPFTYNITTTGGCASATASGTITVATLATITLTSASSTTIQTRCINGTAVTPITYGTGGSATGATATGLPTGVTGTFNAGVLTITGTPTQSGTFTYTVSTTGGCGTATLTGTITVSPALTVNAGPDATIAYGASTQLNGSGTAAANYLWTANGPLALTSATSLNPVANPLQTTVYTLTVSDPAGLCPSVSDNMTVTVVVSCVNVRNAFTPNGDGINDLWYVYDQNFCLAPQNGASVVVYNRYGNKVYENKNYTNNWDGTYKGKPVPDGTYYAVIEFTLFDGKKQFSKTDVTVLR